MMGKIFIGYYILIIIKFSLNAFVQDSSTQDATFGWNSKILPAQYQY